MYSLKHERGSEMMLLFHEGHDFCQRLLPIKLSDVKRQEMFYYLDHIRIFWAGLFTTVYNYLLIHLEIYQYSNIEWKAYLRSYTSFELIHCLRV